MVGKLAAGIVLILLGSAPAHAQEAGAEPIERVVSGVSIRISATTGPAKIGLLPPGESAELRGEVPRWYRINHPIHGPGFALKSWTRTKDSQHAPASQFDVYIAVLATGLASLVRGEDLDQVYDAGSKDNLTHNRFLNILDEVVPGTASIDHVLIRHPHRGSRVLSAIGYYSSMQHRKHANA